MKLSKLIFHMPAREGRLLLPESIVFILILSTILLGHFQPHILETISPYLSGFLILTFGIAHGAIDDKLHLNKVKKSIGKLQFYKIYLAIAIWVIIFFLFSPAIALLLFIIISAFHFGQSQLFYLPIKEDSHLKPLYYSLWGGIILFTMFFYHFTDIQELLHSQPFNFFAESISINMILLTYLMLIAFWIVLSFYFLFRRQISTISLIKEIVGIILFIILNTKADLLLSFAIYFGAIHSLKSIIIEYRILYKIKSRANVKNFSKDLIPNTVLSIIFLFITYIIADYTNSIDPFYVILILGSAISVPHIIFINDIFVRLISKS